jgi:hypothetical protein
LIQWSLKDLYFNSHYVEFPPEILEILTVVNEKRSDVVASILLTVETTTTS